MNEFTNIDDMWSAAVSDILTSGKHVASRNGDSREVLGYQATLTNLQRTVLMNEVRLISPVYAMAEMLWYLSGTSDISMLTAYAPSYIKFAEGMNAFGAYGHRWCQDPAFVKESQGSSFSQLHHVIQLLREQRQTRQAVVSIWNGGDIVHALRGDHADLPCTLVWQLLARDGTLHMIVTMRSNDIWLGFPYDVFVNTTIMRLIARYANLQLGTYTHQVGSVHAYAPHYGKLAEALAPRIQQRAYAKSSEFTHVNWGEVTAPPEAFEPELAEALIKERSIRDGMEHIDIDEIRVPLLIDAVRLCGSKFLPTPSRSIKSAAMREAYDAWR